MALPAHPRRLPLALALVFGPGAALGAALGEPNPVERLMDVTQFGVPRDAKYVFCNGEDCPERSIKHLDTPRPGRAVAPAAAGAVPAGPLTPPTANAAPAAVAAQGAAAGAGAAATGAVAPVPPRPAVELITLSAVTLFDFDRAALRPEGRARLDALVADLKAYPRAGTVRIVGHTDNIGGAAYNQALSERRAQAVRDYLIAGGLAPERIVAAGSGADLPIASNDTAAGRQSNRRVEIEIPVEREIFRRP